MRLYLVQHGLAEAAEGEAERSLTEKGRAGLARIAVFIDAYAGFSAAAIYHSGKLRAHQTAALLAQHISSSCGVVETDGLEPTADPGTWATRLTVQHEDIMLVGHLPHLSRLATVLLTGRTAPEVVTFQNGGIVCLERNIDREWSLLWMVIPEILGECRSDASQA